MLGNDDIRYSVKMCCPVGPIYVIFFLVISIVYFHAYTCFYFYLN